MSQYQPMYDSFQREPRQRYVPTSRISVAASVHLPGSDLDPYTGQLRPDRVRRHRTQAQRLEKIRIEQEDRKLKQSLQREMKKGGVRVTWLTALVVCSALIFGCLFTIGYQRSTLSACQTKINALDRDIKAGTAKNEMLSEQLREARDISTIGNYAARNLGMIRADAVEAVYLTAVDTRPLAGQKRQPVLQSIEASAQATQVPVIASAGN